MPRVQFLPSENPVSPTSSTRCVAVVPPVTAPVASPDKAEEPSLVDENFAQNGAIEASFLERFFATDGVLARSIGGEGRDFEERTQQLEMAQAVARAASEKSHLLVVAGTGTGKSYAYLVPLILWAVAKKTLVIVLV